jgi:hypothetical protein
VSLNLGLTDVGEYHAVVADIQWMSEQPAVTCIGIEVDFIPSHRYHS